MIIGSHVNYGGKGLLGCVEQALNYNANTFMFYTGAPQNTIRKTIDSQNTVLAHELMQRNGMDINHVICHAPYIINLANKLKPDAWNFSISFLRQEIKRCEALGINYIVVHPGSAVSHTREEALKNISEALNYVINVDTKVMILLETMAGKGTECGINISEIKYLLDNVIFKNKIGVCLDTCHLNDSGIDISAFDDYLNEFDKEIGLSKVKCVHVNDSLNVRGAKKDRHANIGLGTIGFDALHNVVHNPKLKDVPKILETPYYEDYPPYKFEIEMLKEGIFYPDLHEKIINYYKNL